MVGAFEVFSRNAIFFRSHDQTDRATQVGFEQRILAFLCQEMIFSPESFMS